MHPLLISEFLSTPWALMPERISAFAAVMARWAGGIQASPEVMAQIAADRQSRNAKRSSAQMAAGGSIAVIPVYGIVTQRGNMADDVSGPGATNTQRVSTALRVALADDTVSQILLDIDSPGGSVYGVQELAAEIYQARSQKPIVAVANSTASSAAYWLASSAGELYVTPGGEVGSIGVYVAHDDYSKALESEGITRTLISAGKYKTEGSSAAPLTDEARAYMQSRINDYYGAFIKAVAKGRGVGIDAVRNGMGQGRVLGADAALAEGMVDGVATFDQVVKKMQSSVKAQSRGAATSAPRLAHAQRVLQTMGA